MDKTVRFRIRFKDDIADVKVMIFHPMETGYRRDKNSKEIIPKHFIHTVNIAHNGKSIMQVHWSRSVSKNPYLNFRVPNASKGDQLTIAWSDNMEQSGTGTAIIS
ncbi:MAG: thiosulfate oxidation carrier complex protein SoxZ [Burkholderiales bacterium]|nr:thiosulfate oxidation carrier complex protein SoxZ [Burkholderiales bacterium]|tara:strand:- start:923 stop:1237 length:315 start_codon:yes stop_codon:yes gene_type:complete